MVDRVEVYIIEENQPRWLAFLNSEHDIVEEIPYDFAPLIVPNGTLAPGCINAASKWIALRGRASDMIYSIWSTLWSVAMSLATCVAPGNYSRVFRRRRDSTRSQGNIDTF